MYKFDDKKHIHTLDDKPLCGVTTALSVISKPALIQWSANMAVEYMDTNLPVKRDGNILSVSADDFKRVLNEAKTAHRKKRDKAGDWGTQVHEAIENWIKNGVEPKLEQENQMEVFNKFKDWAKENKVEFLESEKHLYSRELWIGGIMDLVLTIDGKKYIGDIKTSSGIYQEAFFQMGAYHLCLEEMGEADGIEGYMVINLKKDGKIDFKLATNMEINKQAFKHALSLYKIINSLE
jgi:hypothetical protein